MKFTTIYDLVIPYWGGEIDISDYTIEKVQYSLPNNKKEDGYSKRSLNLSAIWNKVETVVGRDNPYADLMVWTMFQIFHRVSEKLFLEGKSKLFPKEVDKLQIEAQYYQNLKVKDWENELAEYINDLC